MTKKYRIKKSSGEYANFSRKKLFKSLMKSGADKATASHIVDVISENLHPGITTSEVYRKAFSLLRGKEKSFAARYSLKKAIMNLGPSGFPFEKFIVKLLEGMGYSVQSGIYLNGYCVSHEVDAFGHKDNEVLIGECKYHNSQNYESDVKTPLYIKARFDDIMNYWKDKNQYQDKQIKRFIYTNTRFTEDALAYGNCVGLNMVSWSYPDGDALKDIVDRSGLYPVSCLTSITNDHKRFLMNEGIVLVRDIEPNKELLGKIGISDKKIDDLTNEARRLLRKP